MESTATSTTSGTTARALVQSVEAVLSGLDVDHLTTVDRTDLLRSLTVVEGMVAATRSRVLSSSPGASGTGVRRSAELVHETGMSGFEASRAVRLADTLLAVPAAADALAEGRITTGHASVLAGGVSWLNRSAAAVDGSLMEAACHQSVDEFKATVARWELVENGDADGRLLAARQHRNRTLSWFTRDDGMIRLQGDFAPEVGAVVTGAVHALSEHLWRTEDGRSADPGMDPAGPAPSSVGQAAAAGRRSMGQRNADALAELIRRAGSPGTSDDGSHGPDFPAAGRPLVDLLVSVDLARLESPVPGRADGAMAAADEEPGRCTTADGVALPPAAVRRLACDAGIIPVVMGAQGAVLDIGRRNRNIPTAIRKALVVRDGGCAFPGCGRPDSWCDAHHIHHWADGGPTSLDNLVLLCSTHHHVIHDENWTIEWALPVDQRTVGSGGGGWAFRAPGSQARPAGGP